MTVRTSLVVLSSLASTLFVACGPQRGPEVVTVESPTPSASPVASTASPSVAKPKPEITAVADEGSCPLFCSTEGGACMRPDVPKSDLINLTCGAMQSGALSGFPRVACPVNCCAPALNGRPDRDGDGIADDEDLCPIEPEDRDGFQDADGCPDLDNDADAITDVKDKCCFVAEDKDGVQDLDGCPEP